MTKPVVLLGAIAVAFASGQGCAAAGSHSAPAVFQPLRVVCGRTIGTSPDTLTALVHSVRVIANAHITDEGKGQELREILPDHDSFLSLYSDLCWLASFGQIADTDYHRLLDGVLPHLAPPVASLLAPNLTAPADDVVFDHYPRRTTLQWTPVTGAKRYLVEVEIRVLHGAWQPQIGLPPDVTAATEFVFDFDGANPGRWRVRAIDGAGSPGQPSRWRRFVYLR